VDTFLLRVFQRQVELQCRAIIAAATELQRALVAARHDPDEMVNVWIAVQNLLNATANVSKACWGQRGRRKRVRKDLRDSLGIAEPSPLRDPDIRNHFEHYDERLDEWWRTSPRHNHMDMSVASPLSSVRGLDAQDMFRVIDPVTMEVVFWGQTFALRPIVYEAERILPIAAAEAAKPHWD